MCRRGPDSPTSSDKTALHFLVQRRGVYPHQGTFTSRQEREGRRTLPASAAGQLPTAQPKQHFFFFFFFFFFFVEVPRLGLKSGLQLLAYTTATATPDPSRICDLHHSSRQHLILNPLSKARNGTRVFMDTSLVHHC